MKCEIRKLKDLLQSKGYIRGPFGSSLKRGELQNSGIPVYEQQHAIYGTRTFRFFVGEEKYQELKRFTVKENDLIISCSGTVGKVSIIQPGDPTGIISQALLILRCNSDVVLPQFLYYFLLSAQGYHSITSVSSGSVQVNIAKRKIIEDIDVPYFDLQTQKKIISILRALDDKIECNNKIIENLQQQAQAIYENMFTGFRISQVELSTIIDVRDGTHNSPKAENEGYPLITSKHLLPFSVDRASANRISKDDFEKINERSLVETQDILMSMIGTIGLISYVSYPVVDFAIKNVALFKTSHSPEFAYYILCYLKSNATKQYIEKHLAGSTQKYISLRELRKMPVYQPSNAELEKFSFLVNPMFEDIVLRVNENIYLSEIRNTLLPKLMNGEIDVDGI